MTLTLPAIRPGFFGDEAGVERWWDGERWAEEPSGRALLPAAERDARLSAQIATFERAGYRVEQRDDQQATVVRRARRTLRTVISGSATTAHRVVISIDRAGAVRFS